MNRESSGLRDGKRWPAFVGALLLAVVIWSAIGPLDTATPVASTSQEREFSAHRAVDFVHEIMPIEAPHPLGSEANARIRERTMAALLRFGFDVRDAARPFCAYRYDGARCAVVHNIVARFLPDATAVRPVLLTAHYDSVPAGSGVADDMSNVGTLLEIARLRSIGAVSLPLTLLFTDGEEPGMLGAGAALSEGIDTGHVAMNVNLEARGTEGPSIMFEAGPRSEGLVDAFLEHARPVSTASYVASIYQLLPNNTDYSVFRKQGMPGINFAFGGGVSRYHTPRDDFAHLSLSSVQLQGAAVVGTLRSLAKGKGESAAVSIPGFVDLSHWFVVRWDASWTWPLVTLCVILVVGGLWRILRSKALGYREWLLAIVKVVLSVVVGAIVADGTVWLLQAVTKTPSPWLGYPVLTWVAAIGAALFVVLAIWRIATGRQALAAVAGLVTVQCLLLVFLTYVNLGLSALLLVQTLLVAVGLLVFGYSRHVGVRHAALLVGWLASCLVLVPAARTFMLMLTPTSAGIAVVPILLLMLSGLPVFGYLASARRRTVLVSVVIASLGIFAVLLTLPHESAADPAESNVYQIDDTGAGKSWLAAGSPHYPLPSSLAASGGFSDKAEAFWPEPLLGARYASALPAPVAKAPRLTGCEAEAGAADTNVLCLRWADTAGYDVSSFALAEGHGVSVVRYAGVAYPVPDEFRSRGMSISFIGAEAMTQTVDLVVDKPSHADEIVVSGTRYGLSGKASEVASHRTEAELPADDGDKTIVYARQPLPAKGGDGKVNGVTLP